jgi:uncharacterized YccA/Bax inhibitor family protein
MAKIKKTTHYWSWFGFIGWIVIFLLFGGWMYSFIYETEKASALQCGREMAPIATNETITIFIIYTLAHAIFLGGWQRRYEFEDDWPQCLLVGLVKLSIPQVNFLWDFSFMEKNYTNM